jgi:lipopolysaccharide/colanic/teichoic acid biosynthesis glycosyltransferase
MWDEAVRFDGAAPSSRISAGGVVEYSEGLDQASEVCWHGDRVKRALDAILAVLGLFLSFPVWLFISLAIKLEDRGPILYRQDRVGLKGKVFQALKFRSMVADAEEAVGPVQASHHDPRVTRVGQILRATALDELPQLWSILWGDMSFVGPRALRPGEIEVNGSGECVPLEAIFGYAERHAVRPGLTGLAQVYAPRDIPRHQKFRYDLLYIRRRTLWLDLRLVAVSLWISLRGRWG